MKSCCGDKQTPESQASVKVFDPKAADRLLYTRRNDWRYECSPEPSPRAVVALRKPWTSARSQPRQKTPVAALLLRMAANQAALP